MAEDTIPRRDFLTGAGAAGAGAAALTGGVPPADAAEPANAPVETWLVLTADEVAFFSAIADTMIPADALSPSGSECGVPVFIDRQLASAWGAGAKMYRAGPFHAGAPEQGYQLPLTPREFFAAGIAAANEWSRKTGGKDFDQLSAPERVAALKAMEAGKAEFNGVPSRMFFNALLSLAMEGMFAAPMYGGNRDKVGWKMLGYPGLPATYADKIDEWRNKRYVAPPQSIADFS